MGKHDVLPIMIKDHSKIERLLDILEEDMDKDFKTMKKSFHHFEWELEKHLFVEEKAIFTNYTPEDAVEGYKMLPVITEQHNFILNTLNNWRNEVVKNHYITNISELKEFLVRHREYEENELYPKLDQSLDETQKKHIIDKIEQILEK